MNSERPPESASSTPTGPGGSDGLREGPGYFLFESRRPFEHELTFHVPVHSTDNMLAQQAAPTAARGGGKAAKGDKGGGKGGGKGCGRVAHQTHFAPPTSTPDTRLSRRSDGGRVAAAGDLTRRRAP